MRLPSLLGSLLSSEQDRMKDAYDYDDERPSTSAATAADDECSNDPGLQFTPSHTNKVYRQLKRDCVRRKQLFVDLDFPPTNDSLFLDGWEGEDLEIQWKRPGEIVDNPKLFVEGASPYDVTQGILGNCWFVSACSALTHNEALLQKVIPDSQVQEWDDQDKDAYRGIFQFCFWRFGRWVDVIIDDLLPTKNGELLFARSKTPNEFWSALLEKAFAKLYGCYENLVGGQLADALQDVSGGVVENKKVSEFVSKQQQEKKGEDQQEEGIASPRRKAKPAPQNQLAVIPPNNIATTNGVCHAGLLAPGSNKLTIPSSNNGGERGSTRLFHTLMHAFDQEALIVAAIAANKNEVERSLECGLVIGHAYAITSIREVKLAANGVGADRQQQAVLDNGSAEMGAQRRTPRQKLVRLQNPWGEKEWNGPWSDGSVEWQQVEVDEGDKNRIRIPMEVAEDGEFWMPWEEFVNYFTDISMCRLLNTKSLVDPAGLKREMSQRASRKSNATVGVAPRQYREWNFFGRWSTNGVKQGAPNDRAGGSKKFTATFCFNPQFLLDIGAEANVKFALIQKDRFKGGSSKHREPYLVIGLHLLRVERNRRHRVHHIQQTTNANGHNKQQQQQLALEGLVTESGYSSARSVFLSYDGLPSGRYVLIPTTYAPREEGEFLLRVYSTRDASPRQQQRQGQGTHAAKRNRSPVELTRDVPLGGMAKCRRQVRCVARVRILEVELTKEPERDDPFDEFKYFCRIHAGKDKTKGAESSLVESTGTTIKFDDAFVFHSASLYYKITVELVKRNEKDGGQVVEGALGKAVFRTATENACILLDVEMRRVRQTDGKRVKNNKGDLLGKLRVEVSSYDDPLYL